MRQYMQNTSVNGPLTPLNGNQSRWSQLTSYWLYMVFVYFSSSVNLCNISYIVSVLSSASYWNDPSPSSAFMTLSTVRWYSALFRDARPTSWSSQVGINFALAHWGGMPSWFAKQFSLEVNRRHLGAFSVLLLVFLYHWNWLSNRSELRNYLLKNRLNGCAIAHMLYIEQLKEGVVQVVFELKCSSVIYVWIHIAKKMHFYTITITMTMNLFSNLHYIHIAQNTTCI